MPSLFPSFYHAIVFDLLCKRPELHAHLHRQRLLMAATEYYAHQLKELHESWERHLAATRTQGQAMRLAQEELEQLLPSACSSEAAGRPPFDELLTLLRHHILPA